MSSAAVPPPGEPGPQQPYGQQPYPQQPYPQQPYPQQPYPQQPYPGQPYPQQPVYSGHQQVAPPGLSALPRTGYGRALAGTSLWAGLNYLLILLIALTVADGSEVGDALATEAGALLGVALLASLPTWLVVRRRPGGWPFWQVALVGLGFFLLVRILSVAGRTAGAA